MTEVLIFVPGLMGSELWDDDGRIWPGSLRDAIFGFDDQKFARLMQSDLEARDIVRKAVGIVDIYGSWIEAFSSLKSRKSGASLFSQKGESPTLFIVPYDWRKSIAVGAAVLADVILDAVEIHGDDTRLYIAAHSMGGMVARYFLDSGNFEDSPGFRNVESLITFGSPHKGAPMALAGALGLEKVKFLSSIQSRSLANDARLTGLYDLFPQPGACPLWESGAEGTRLTPRDIWEDDIAVALKLNGKSMSASRATIEQIEKPIADIRRFLFIGNRLRTLSHFLFQGETVIPVESEDGGDGTVNLQGSVLEDHQIRFVDKNHMSLIESRETRFALQEIFDADGILPMSRETRVVITVSDLIVAGRSPFEVILSLEGPSQEVDGHLFFQKARTEVSALEANEADFHSSDRIREQEIRYSGPDLLALHLSIDELGGPGVYRAVFKTNSEPTNEFLGPPFLVTLND